MHHCPYFIKLQYARLFHFTCRVKLKHRQDCCLHSHHIWFSKLHLCVKNLSAMLFPLKSSLSIKYCIKSEFPFVEESEDGSPQLFIFSSEMKGNAQEDEVSPRGWAWTSIHAQYYYHEYVSTSAVLYIYPGYLFLAFS